MHTRSVTSGFVLAAVLTGVAVLALVRLGTVSAQQEPWPRIWTIYGDRSMSRMNLFKTAGMEMTDPMWAHLHKSMSDAQSVDLGMKGTDVRSNEKPLPTVTDVQVRWLVKGRPVSDWLDTPFAFTLKIDNPGLPETDGIFDISIDMQGPGKMNYTFTPLFLHLYRGRPVDPEVPVCSRDVQYDDQGEVQGPGCRYIKYADMHRVGRPADPTVTPWHGPTWQEPGLYQEELMPHTNIFHGQQMWWEEPYDGVSAGLKFARAMVPKWDEEHRGLRVNWHHDRFPFVDGPRGIGWTSTYIMGQVDLQGNFCFVEAGGPLRCMDPTGTIVTKVGWHVTPGKDPVWVLKTLEQVRRNETFEGVFVSGRYTDGSDDGFRTPLDLAIDPKNASIYYVAGYEDQVIWKADCTTFPTAPCQVSVFAGDPAHSYGFKDGSGTAARLNGPASLVFDPICDCLYVADQNNDAIRKITRAGVVTTLFGSPGQDRRQIARGVTVSDRYVVQGQNRTAAKDHYVRGGYSSTTLETYLPQAIRVDSKGDIILLDIGFGSIRRVNPTTLEATHLAVLTQRFDHNDEGAPTGGITGSSRGFAFLDVDRWGTTGPIDQIYFGVFQGSGCDGETAEHVNEAYCVMPSTGAPAHFVFPRVWDPLPDGWGPREATSPPHYYWLMQVDPRGALILGGGGEHGLTRLRKQKTGDVTFKDDNALLAYGDGKMLWKFGQGGLEPTPVLRNGSEAHSYLGLPDATDYKNATDAQIVAAFGFGSYKPQDRVTLINFIRLNAWRTPPPATPSSKRVR